MKRSGIAVAFVVGALFGLCAGRLMPHRPPQANPDRILARLTRDLSLDEAQRGQAREILTAEQASIKTLREKTHAELEETRTRGRAKLAEILKPEQKEKFERLTARWEARHRKIWKEEPR